MSDKVRVYEIADEAGASSNEVISKAKDLGIELKSPQSAVSFEQAEEIANYIMTGKSSKVKAKPAAKPKKMVAKEETKEETPTKQEPKENASETTKKETTQSEENKQEPKKEEKIEEKKKKKHLQKKRNSLLILNVMKKQIE